MKSFGAKSANGQRALGGAPYLEGPATTLKKKAITGGKASDISAKHVDRQGQTRVTFGAGLKGAQAYPKLLGFEVV